jgi:ankyrin repeat protein
MLTLFPKIEARNFDNPQSNPVQIERNFERVAAPNSSSKKSSYRKFLAENNLHPNFVSQETLTEQFKTGALQQKIENKLIDPHTLIHQAILENNPEVINFFLAHGVDVDYPDENDMSPLTIAILNRCNYALDVLLANHANVNPDVKWNGMSLLQISLSMKDAASASKLVDYGVDLSLKDKSGQGILNNVIQLAYTHSRDWVIVAKSMIEHGADIHACVHPDCPFFQSIWYAQSTRDRSLLELFINKGADPNMAQIFKGEEYSTPLLVAIRTGQLALVRFLVESEADVNKIIRNRAGQISPLKQALDSAFPEIVQYLLQHGARV